MPPETDSMPSFGPKTRTKATPELPDRSPSEQAADTTQFMPLQLRPDTYLPTETQQNSTFLP